MPDVTFTRDTSDADATITGLGSGVWVLNCPASPDTLTLESTTSLDLHTSITVPAGYTIIILPYNDTFIPGAPDCFVITGTFKGSGASIPLLLNCLNRSATSQTPTAGQPVAKVLVLKNEQQLTSTPFVP